MLMGIDRFAFKILNLLVQGPIKSLAIIVARYAVTSSATVDLAPVLVQVVFSVWRLPVVVWNNRSLIIYFEPVVKFAVNIVVVIL